MKNVFLALCLLLPSCGALSGANDGGLQRQLIETLSVFGDAAIRMEGTRLLNKHAPGLIPFIDQDKDQQISLAEITSFIQNADAAQIVVLGTIFFSDR
jgi:hypothetical protein